MKISQLRIEIIYRGIATFTDLSREENHLSNEKHNNVLTS